MTDNQIDRSDCPNRAAERDFFSDAKMQRAEFTFMNAFLNLVKNKAPIAPMSPAASFGAKRSFVRITGLGTFAAPLCYFDRRVGGCLPQTMPPVKI
jgi:hypothetical protein